MNGIVLAALFVVVVSYALGHVVTRTLSTKFPGRVLLLLCLLATCVVFLLANGGPSGYLPGWVLLPMLAASAFGIRGAQHALDRDTCR